MIALFPAMLVALVALALAVSAYLAVQGFAKTSRDRLEANGRRLAAVESRCAEMDAQVAASLEDAEAATDVLRRELAAHTAETDARLRSLDTDLKACVGAGAELGQRTTKLEATAASTDQAVAEVQQAVTDAAARLDGQIDGLRRQVSGWTEELRAQIDGLDIYVKETFQTRLDSALRAFDGTVSGVLGEMKGELLRGVHRIEEIESVVTGRTEMEDRLLSGPSEPPPAPEPDDESSEAPEPDETAAAPSEQDGPPCEDLDEASEDGDPPAGDEATSEADDAAGGEE